MQQLGEQNFCIRNCRSHVDKIQFFSQSLDGNFREKKNQLFDFFLRGQQIEISNHIGSRNRKKLLTLSLYVWIYREVVVAQR